MGAEQSLTALRTYPLTRAEQKGLLVAQEIKKKCMPKDGDEKVYLENLNREFKTRGAVVTVPRCKEILEMDPDFWRAEQINQYKDYIFYDHGSTNTTLQNEIAFHPDQLTQWNGYNPIVRYITNWADLGEIAKENDDGDVSNSLAVEEKYNHNHIPENGEKPAFTIGVFAEWNTEKEGRVNMRFDFWFQSNTTGEKGSQGMIRANTYDICSIALADGTMFRLADLIDLHRFGRRQIASEVSTLINQV